MTAIDTDRASLTLVKQFAYRGNDEEWSNTYFFTGDLPADAASWKTLADNVVAVEKTLYPSTTKMVRAIGHQAGESVAVWAYDYLAVSEEVAGTYALTNTTQDAGDSAQWLRWSTDLLTERGKPIYLRNYYHPGFRSTSGTADAVAALWQSNADTFGADWIAGFADGDAELHARCGPHGVVGLVATSSEWVTTRTLKRRGKRPTTP